MYDWMSDSSSVPRRIKWARMFEFYSLPSGVLDILRRVFGSAMSKVCRSPLARTKTF